MKYIFYVIFIVLGHFAIALFGLFSILVSLWYWDGEYISIVSRASDDFIDRLKNTL